ncbi:thioredoxin domain-containing protein 11-like isoform X2 [Xenia sp. Carnegie-2017]|nr:thioredoxin domain-containing protein 11-like isoform X2 [Xenia sp. Carnegie-2017]
MYYAHWCAQSKKAVYEFHRTSKIFKGQVSFFAINCWAGPCRKSDFPQSYPLLILFHTNYEPLQFKGKQKYKELVNFVSKALRPITFISSHDILVEFTNRAVPFLVFFMNSINYFDQNYDEFFGAALHSLSKGSYLEFAIVTSRFIADVINLKAFGEVILLNPLKAGKVFPYGLNYNWTSLLQWANQNIVAVVSKLDPDIMEADQFGKILKRHSSLILFLPLNDENMNSTLLHTYRQVAMSYHNCSCSPEPSTTSSEKKHYHSLISVDSGYRDFFTTCQSLPLRHRHGIRNACVLCKECHRACSFLDSSFPLFASRDISLPRNSCCSLRRNSYQLKNSFSVCCFDDEMRRVGKRFNVEIITTDKDASFEENKEEYAQSLEDRSATMKEERKSSTNFRKSSINFMFTPKISDVEISLPDMSNIQNQSIRTVSLPNYDSSYYPPEYGTCEHPGIVREFAGAYCYSNNSVTFYYMDSRKFWKFAVALGVKQNITPRTALVLLDFANEAQYVHEEGTPLSNASIVNFLMLFKLGNLTRRLRSAVVPKQSCSQSSSCIWEVVTTTFDDLVLHNNQNVFLMFYTPWCGFCKSVKPVMKQLADHYKNSPDIRIARINGDLNDLPWEYNVDSYPSFIFFPARRKTESVKFPQMGDRTFEKFVRFVEAHKTNPVTKDSDCFNAQVSLNYLKRNLNSIKIENLNLRRRLKREILTRKIAEKGGSNVERLLNKKNKMLSDSEAKLMNL